jgi:hypothetical protein
MVKQRLNAQYPLLLGLLLSAAVLVSVFATEADARRARNTASGVAIGAGVGALVDGGRGAVRGGAIGALIGSVI